MSFLATNAKAATFFVLGVLLSCAAVAMTHAADAQFGLRRAAHVVGGLTWYFQRADIPTGQGSVAAKCPPGEVIISGGYKLVNVDATRVHILQSYPDNFENAYVVVIRNDYPGPIIAYSDVGCSKM
jgi:hypothetical protein